MFNFQKYKNMKPITNILFHKKYSTFNSLLENYQEIYNRLPIKTISLNKVKYIKDLPDNISKSFIKYSIKHSISNELNIEFNDYKTVSKGLMKINKTISDNLIETNTNFNHYILNENYDIKLLKNLYIHFINKTIYSSLDQMRINSRYMTINDILNVSLTPLFLQDDINSVNFINYFKEHNINDNEINNYIKNKVKNNFRPSTYNIIQHPNNNENEFISNKEIISIQCGKYDNSKTVSDFNRLLEYSNKIPGVLNKITIYNPLLGYEKYIDLNEF